MQLQIVAHAVHFNQPGNSQSLPFKITKKTKGSRFCGTRCSIYNNNNNNNNNNKNNVTGSHNKA